MTSQAEISRRPGGHIYVIEFSTGIIKVGRTCNADRRLDEHVKSAMSHACTVHRSWFSPRHTDFQQNEDRLISFCKKRFGAPSVGNETFDRADFEATKAYAESLNFRVYERPAQPIGDLGIDALLEYARRPARLRELTRQAGILISLTNDSNRAAANDELYIVMVEVASLTPSPWSLTDPDAALKHLRLISRDERNVDARARNFENSGRALFFMGHGRWPDSFMEIVGDVKVLLGQAQPNVLVCKACDSDWGVQESDDGSCLNCGLGTADPSDSPAGVIYESPRFAGDPA